MRLRDVRRLVHVPLGARRLFAEGPLLHCCTSGTLSHRGGRLRGQATARLRERIHP